MPGIEGGDTAGLADQVVEQPSETTAVEFELAEEGEQVTSEAGTDIPATPTTQEASAPESPVVLALQQRVDTAERLARQAEARWNQLMELQERAARQAQAPQVDTAAILAKLQRGEGTQEDLAQYLEAKRQEDDYRARMLFDSISQRTRVDAEAAASEQKARGIFTAAAMGEGFDFDTMRDRYVQPLYDQRPELKQITQSMADPATFEMYISMVAMIDQHPSVKGDAAKALKTLVAALNGAPGAAAGGAQRATVTSIEQAAKRGAQRLLHGNQPQGGSVTKKIRPEDVSTMSDSDFEQFRRQHGAKI